MINILLNGCNGKMGQTITSILLTSRDITISAGISPGGQKRSSYPVFKNLWECNENFDMIVDFSNVESLDVLLEFALSKNKPLIIGTTGYTEEQLNKISEASNLIPIFISSNTSLGVNLLYDLVKSAAVVLGRDFDVEIIEKHHNQKVDAPSGTAISIANAISEATKNDFEYVYDRHSQKQKRTKNEIGIHSMRGGTIIGEHSVIFAGNDEIIEIKHTALSKKIYAEGIVRIIKFMARKPSGLYRMKNIM